MNLRGPGEPTVTLLDGAERALDGPGLRAWARDCAAHLGIRHTSRSYREPYALLAWFERPVGVDLERLEPLDAAFAESICTPRERAALAHRFEEPEFVASLWSSKEALAKALGEPLAHDPRRLDSPLVWPGGAAGPWRARQLAAVPARHVAWMCWRTVG